MTYNLSFLLSCWSHLPRHKSSALWSELRHGLGHSLRVKVPLSQSIWGLWHSSQSYPKSKSVSSIRFMVQRVIVSRWGPICSHSWTLPSTWLRTVWLQPSTCRGDLNGWMVNPEALAKELSIMDLVHLLSICTTTDTGFGSSLLCSWTWTWKMFGFCFFNNSFDFVSFLIVDTHGLWFIMSKSACIQECTIIFTQCYPCKPSLSHVYDWADWKSSKTAYWFVLRCGIASSCSPASSWFVLSHSFKGIWLEFAKFSPEMVSRVVFLTLGFISWFLSGQLGEICPLCPHL